MTTHAMTAQEGYELGQLVSRQRALDRDMRAFREKACARLGLPADTRLDAHPERGEYEVTA